MVLTPAAHLRAAQIVVGPYLRHAPEPLHVPSLPQLVGPSSLHVPAGSIAPRGTAAHVPTEPGRLHEKQLPAHADPQQTPCAQNPLVHSSGLAHRPPFGFLPHEPAWQMLGLAHSVLEAHELAQRLAAHL